MFAKKVPLPDTHDQFFVCTANARLAFHCATARIFQFGNYLSCAFAGEVTSPGVLSGEMITTIGPPRLSEAPAPSAGGSTEELQPAMDSTSSAAGSLAQDRQEEGEGGAVNAEETAALNARLDALQGLVDNLQLELAIGSSHEAQVPTLFSVARSSSLLAIFIYPVMLLLSYLSWRVLPIGLISFAVLGWFSPSWWYGMFVFISSVVLALWLVHVSKSSSLETFRRRMYVYGLAFSIWADYRIVRNQTADLDEQESEVVWGVAHRRSG